MDFFSNLLNRVFILKRRFEYTVDNKKFTFKYQNDFTHFFSRSYISQIDNLTIIVNFTNPSKNTDIVFNIYHRGLIIFRTVEYKRHFKDIRDIIEFNLNRAYYLFSLNDHMLKSLASNIHVKVTDTDYLDAYKYIYFYQSNDNWVLNVMDINDRYKEHLFFQYRDTLWLNHAKVYQSNKIQLSHLYVDSSIISNKDSMFYRLKYTGSMVKSEYRTIVSYAGSLVTLDIISNDSRYKVIKYSGNSNQIFIYKIDENNHETLILSHTTDIKNNLNDFSNFNLFETELIDFFAKNIICPNYLAELGLSYPLNNESLEMLKLMNY